MAIDSGDTLLAAPICTASVEIRNAEGLHMRPAMHFVDVANKFACEITVTHGDNSVDGKSIMQISMLAATQGTTLCIKAQGVDADEAVQALRELIEVKMFNE
ncbi:MAG: HPr family phosphocarrier protein [Planctomycetes bacterium]|nr:HPr family phosphocarrier protein [Planctomycetota bacterium]